MYSTLIPYQLIIALLMLASCGGNDAAIKNENAVARDTVASDVVQTPDTSGLSYFDVDDYPVTNEMFRSSIRANEKTNYHQSGKTFAHDYVWYSNDSLKQALVFGLYTDYYRVSIYHFYTNDIPKEMVSEMELHGDEGQIAPEEQKQKDFAGFLEHTSKIGSHYFTTNKGFKLGDKKQKAIDQYGQPDSTSTREGIEKLEWNFEGENEYDEKYNPDRKPVARFSFGFYVEMYFRKDKLIALVMHNAVP